MSIGLRHDDLRRRNRASVIQSVRRGGQPSRTEIAATTALSHSTISTIAADLIAEGILTEAREMGPAAQRRGRPQVALALHPAAGCVAILVLSLNALSGIIVDYAGQSLHERSTRFQTQTVQRETLLRDMVAMIQSMIDQARPRTVVRIVVSVQGVTDSAARALLWSPIMPHTDLAIADRLEDATGIAATVENDCNMMAVALRWRDPARYRDNFIALLLSDGIGMGLVLKSQVFTGTKSSGGEFGHMIHRPGGALCRCGRRGCIEAYAGSYGIWRNAHGIPEDAQPAADIPERDLKRLAERARAEDGAEREAFRIAGEAIGYGLGGIFALFDPAPVAVVGHGVLAFDLMETALHEAIGRTAGGRHAEAISFDTDADEMRLIRDGCAMHGLTFADTEIAAAGLLAARSGPCADDRYTSLIA